MSEESDYFNKHYGQLKNRRIIGIVHDGNACEQQKCYGLTLDNGWTVWIMCDPEGNGPGFLDLQSSK